MNLQNFGCYAVKHFKEVKNNRFVCPVLRFLPDMKPWFFAKAFRWRVAPCGAEVALRSPGGVAWRHGMCFYDVFDASTERCFKPLGRVQRQRHMMLDTVHISSRTDGCHKAPVMWRDLEFLSLQDMAPLCQFVSISLHFTRFHFRTGFFSPQAKMIFQAAK